MFLARDVSPAPSGWPLVGFGVFLLVGGFLLVSQAWFVWRRTESDRLWKGIAGIVGYMGLMGLVAVPIGLCTVVA